MTNDGFRRTLRRYAALLGVSAAVALGGAAFAAALASGSAAAPATAPTNAGEPSISGTPVVGSILNTSDGTWTGTQPIELRFQWVRCNASGSKPDGSDCAPISSARGRTYEVRRADVGHRLRVRVTARNADGSATVASNPTAVVTSARPVNTSLPSISGSMVVGNRIQASRGSWAGVQPITYAFRWLRCNQQGSNCGEIAGATDSNYLLVSADAGRTLKVRVTARNDAGSTTALSQQTSVVQAKGPPPTGSTIPVSDVPSIARLVVSQVAFSPDPVRSRTDPITVRIRVTDTRGYVIQGALVFVRATPRATSSGDHQQTGSDGWVTYQLVPNQYFPQPENGYHVQFFVKAYRAGDPPLAGVAGYRLVQVNLAR